MNMDEINKHRAEKDHLMRNEGTHPANRRFKSKTEMLAEDMIKDAEKLGLHMEAE